jgi:methyltransferase (TIGR00027 family)
MNQDTTPKKLETISEYEKYMIDNRDGSITAESLALVRAKESGLKSDERICYDPYAIKFVNPELLQIYTKMSPDTMQKMQDSYENQFPGHKNALVARVRFFDDQVKMSISKGFTQIVIFGAGYDTRAYRIDGITKVRVFEIDLPVIQDRKKSKIKDIFGSLPNHVTYIPVDLSINPLEKAFIGTAFDYNQKTLYLMEGLILYIPPKQVKELFSSIISLSAQGSGILFDSMDEGIIDGSDLSSYALNLRNQMSRLGEPFAFGIRKGEEEKYMTEVGFKNVRVVTKEEYYKQYFTGVNKSRNVSEIFNFVYAEM